MSRRTLLNLLLSAAGGALLVWQIQKLGGLAIVADGLTRVGLGFVLILVLSLARFALRAYAWVALVGQPAPISAALAATISGDALGNLTLLGVVASEPAKAVFLGRHVEPTRGFAALTAENFFYVVSVSIYVIVGAVALLVEFPNLPEAVRLGGISACVLMAIVLAILSWVAWQRPALASATLARIPSRRVAAVIDRVRDFEVRTYGSTGHESTRLGRVAVAETAFHVLSFVETWFTLYLIAGASLLVSGLILDSLNRVINAVFKFVPMRVGVDEVTSEMFGSAIGLASGVGFQVALVRKVRMIVWAAVGMVIWGLRTGTTGTTGSR